MNVLLRHLQFRPHGDNLLSSSTRFWLISALIVVFAMASSEAIAWAYLGYLFGEGPLRWFSAAFTGATMFLVVWMIDVTLITIDTAWNEHSRTILGQHTSVHGRRIRQSLTTGLRIAFLFISLSITAPFLAQLVYHKDIEQNRASKAARAIDEARKRLVTQYDAPINTKDKEIEKARSEYVNETAGKGPSKMIGDGPVAKAILVNVLKLEKERNELVREKQNALLQFDALAQDWRSNREKLAALYNVALPESSILQSREALEDLSGRPAYRATELAIKTFLALVFSAILLLKLFEPNSVRLYLSEVLQQEYLRFLAGSFDEFLPVTERSTNPRWVMPPQRFYEFLKNYRRGSVAKTKVDLHASASQRLEELGILLEKASRDLTQARSEFQLCCDATDQSKRNLYELNGALAAARADLAACQGQMLELESNNSPWDTQSRLKFEAHLRTTMISKGTLATDLNSRQPLALERLGRAGLAMANAEARVRAKEADVTQVETSIRNVRRVLLDSIEGETISTISSDERKSLPAHASDAPHRDPEEAFQFGQGLPKRLAIGALAAVLVTCVFFSSRFIHIFGR